MSQSISYCFRCKRDTRDVKLEIVFTSNNRWHSASLCRKCKWKKSCFISGKYQRGNGFIDYVRKEGKHIGKFYKDIYQHLRQGKVPRLQRRIRGNPDSRSVIEKKFQRYKKGVVKRQHEFNRKVGNSTERIRKPNEVGFWHEHQWWLDNDKEYRERYKKNPMIDGDHD